MSGQFGLFLLATRLMSLSPGPNVFLLVSLGLRDGAVAGLQRGVNLVCGLFFIAAGVLLAVNVATRHP